jgi:hypothetical protein
VGKTDDELAPLELHEIEQFKGSKPDTLTDLKSCMETMFCKAGQTLFKRAT